MKHGVTLRAALKALALLALPLSGGAASAACKLSKLLDLPVTMIDMKPMVTAKINGADAWFVADSGAFYSMLSPASAAQLNLKTYAAPYGLRLSGVGGEASISATMVKAFTLSGLPIHNIEFLVGGGETGGGGVGVLGQNVFRAGDVEYDLGKGVIRLLREEDCHNSNLAYWVHGTEQPFSMMSIEETTPLVPHTTGVATLNGVKIRVTFDTGSDVSMLSVRAARRAGVNLDSPGVTYAGTSRGVGRGMAKTWIAPFASFKLGDEEIRNTHLRIGEYPTDSTDMLIGADFFLSHRVYVANKQRKLFFTYNGGPVFNLTSSPSPPRIPVAAGEAAGGAEGAVPAGAAGGAEGAVADAAVGGGAAAAEDPAAVRGAAAAVAPATPATAASSAAPAPARADEPADAAGFSRRGSAFAARRDFTHAIADLTRACELAPGEADYFYERGVAELKNNQPAPALADFSQAIALKADHVPALLARAELRLAQGQVPPAIADLDAVDHAAAKEADARLRLAEAYAPAGLLPHTVAQLDSWIAAHAADARMSEALQTRCRARALEGAELPKALADCNAALRLTGKSPTEDAVVRNSRALVLLRLGDYDKSIGDYDAALRVRPGDAWSLYGRGIDEVRRGRAADGQKDMAAAAAVWPKIAEAFAQRGIAP